MKTSLKSWIAVVSLTVGVGVSNAFADLEVSGSIQIHAAADFDAPLASQGAWIDAGSYGRCWHPANVAADWRPYCSGYWEYTDCGWYWESDEPWAWACYHYGSWVDQPSVGWVWVPDTEWAPAWVSWRMGGGYIGWAPAPPRRLGGFAVGAPALPFVFVAEDRFHDHFRPSTVIVNNTTIINKTTVVGNVRRESRSFEGGGPRNVNVNVGPPVAEIQKSTGRQVQPIAIHEAVAHTRAPKLEAQPANHGRPGVPASPQPNRPLFGNESRSGNGQERTRGPAPEGAAQPAIPQREKPNKPEVNAPPPTGRSSGAPVNPNNEEQRRGAVPPPARPPTRPEAAPPSAPPTTGHLPAPSANPGNEQRAREPASTRNQPPTRPEVVPPSTPPPTGRPTGSPAYPGNEQQQQPREKAPTPSTPPTKPEAVPPNAPPPTGRPSGPPVNQRNEERPREATPAPQPAPPAKNQDQQHRRDEKGGGQN